MLPLKAAGEEIVPPADAIIRGLGLFLRAGDSTYLHVILRHACLRGSCAATPNDQAHLPLFRCAP